MNRAMIVGLGVLAAALLIGCNNSSRPGPRTPRASLHPDAQLMQDWFEIVNRRMDLAGMPGPRAQELRDLLDERGRELRKVFDSWPKDKQDAMNTKYKAEKDRLNARLLKALMPPPP